MKHALALLLLLACGPHDVELVQFPGGRPRPMTICSTNTDCNGDEFCEKIECEDVQGHCAPANFCPPMPGGEVCGCDNVTYANNCTRRVARIAAGVPGSCQ